MVPEMMNKIRMSLKMVDARYHIVKRVLVGNQNLRFIKNNLAYLEAEGFEFYDAPLRECICLNPVHSPYKRLPYERSFDLADMIILGVILDEALENRLPPSIFLASSDSDFTEPLKTLRHHRYNLLVYN